MDSVDDLMITGEAAGGSMAIEISPRLQAECSVRHQPKNNLLLRTRRARAAYRRARRRITPAAGHRPGSAASVAPAFEATGDAFRQNAWAFIDPFFDSAWHRDLVRGWPPRSQFNPMATILKAYDFGFAWRRGNDRPQGLDRFPALSDLYSFLQSEDFARRVTDYCGDGIDRTCYSIVTSWASGGSALIPHRDSIAVDPRGESFLNFVIFVDGSGGESAGGTCILADNEFRDVTFEPTALTNTALVYRSTAPFFHGFRPMRPRTFRWTVNAQFTAPDVVASPDL